jgi:hypothetical protein
LLHSRAVLETEIAARRTRYVNRWSTARLMRASRPATAAHRVDVRAARDEPVLASDEVQAKAAAVADMRER